MYNMFNSYGCNDIPVIEESTCIEKRVKLNSICILFFRYMFRDKKKAREVGQYPHNCKVNDQNHTIKKHYLILF